MKKIYLIIVLAIILVQSCGKSGTKQAVNSTIDSKDSLLIAGAFIPPFTHADSIYTALKTIFEKNETALDLLNLNYAKALIMTGGLGKADTLIKQATSRAGFDTSSLVNAKYANLQAAIEAYKQNQEGAISYYKKAIRVFENYNDYKNAASVNFNIANIFLSRLNYPMAYQYSTAAVQGFKAVSDTLYYPAALAVSAVSAIMLGKKEEAWVTAQQARQISERYKNPLGKAMSGYALAEIAMYNKQYDTAISYFKSVIPLAQQLQQVTIAAAAYTSLAKAYLENEDYDLVITEGKQAVAFSEKYQYKDVSYALNRYISQAYQQKGDEHSALKYMRMADEHFRDEVVTNDRRVMGELLVQYEAEKKDKLLAEQQLEIQKKNAVIRNWLIAGMLLLLGSIFYLYQNRKSQKQKLLLLKQENENAVLKAIMNSEEQERRNISNTLHDSVGAKLGAAKMSLQSIPFLAEDKKNGQLEKTAQLISSIHGDVRSIAHNLLPVTLEKEGLVPAINEFVEEMNQLNLLEIKIDNRHSAAVNLSKRNELVLYRIIQELVNNIVKHANATEATVCIAYTNRQLEIRVSDNGVGFGTNAESHGLYSIRERLNTIGGTFNIHAEENNGTVAMLTLKA